MNKVFQRIAVVIFMSITTLSFQATAQRHGGGGGHGGGFGGHGGGRSSFGGNHGGFGGGAVHSARPFEARPSGGFNRHVSQGAFNRPATVHSNRFASHDGFGRRAPVIHNRTVVNNYHRTTVINRGYVHGGYYGHPSVVRYYHPVRPVYLFGHPHYGYLYHPYRPYYWGPSWHPVGFFVGALASAAIIISFNHQPYHYYSGVYYEPYNGGYRAIAPPIGISINVLPPGYDEIPVDGINYYYYGGVYYRNYGSEYRVVAAPYGAVVYNLPDGAEQVTVNGNIYMYYNNTYYQPINDNGNNAYEVVDIRMR